MPRLLFCPTFYEHSVSDQSRNSSCLKKLFWTLHCKPQSTNGSDWSASSYLVHCPLIFAAKVIFCWNYDRGWPKISVLYCLFFLFRNFYLQEEPSLESYMVHCNVIHQICQLSKLTQFLLEVRLNSDRRGLFREFAIGLQKLSALRHFTLDIMDCVSHMDWLRSVPVGLRHLGASWFGEPHHSLAILVRRHGRG